jgi:hypothetical protein
MSGAAEMMRTLMLHAVTFDREQDHHVKGEAKRVNLSAHNIKMSDK